ncbi:DUF7882 family protein [Leucobacter sp. GX0328]
MGHLHYGLGESFEFDDRLLTHLRTVILSKFALQEALALTWHTETTQHSVWLHPSVPLHFEFDVPETPELNRAWLEKLRDLANSAGGLRCVDEPVDASVVAEA